MSLAETPLVLILIGLTAYAVLGGADFGAGFWSFPSLERRGTSLRDHAHEAIGPVWETNHVWLVFVLVVCWTAYPTAFGSIMSTLAIPLFVAAVGIILRGSAYALRVGTAGMRELGAVDTLFAVASVLTPFALGAAIGGIASGRVPVGNAAGDPLDSWLNPTSITAGLLSVAFSIYLAAVYLAADAVRMNRRALAERFRRHALAAAVLAGAAATAGLAVVHSDARPIWNGLTSGGGLAAVIVSGVAGVTTVGLVWQRRFEPARYAAALAVAAVLAGWALAQRPDLLPGLTIDDAAAGRPTLIAVLVAAAIGAAVLVPSLVLLYGLVLRGRFEAEPRPLEIPRVKPQGEANPFRSGLALFAGGALAVGAALTLAFDGAVVAVGVGLLFAFLVSGFILVATDETR